MDLEKLLHHLDNARNKLMGEKIAQDEILYLTQAGSVKTVNFKPAELGSPGRNTESHYAGGYRVNAASAHGLRKASV